MRIISQSKRYSFNFDNKDMQVNHCGIFVVQDNGTCRCVATYEDEERAMEVFDIIHARAIEEVRACPELSVYELPEK